MTEMMLKARLAVICERSNQDTNIKEKKKKKKETFHSENIVVGMQEFSELCTSIWQTVKHNSLTDTYQLFGGAAFRQYVQKTTDKELQKRQDI